MWIDPRRRGVFAGQVRMDTKAQARQNEHGFTLLELLVVLAILGLLVGLVAPAALWQLGSSQVNLKFGA